MSTATPVHPPPIDATLTVTRAAVVLGVHPNTIRSWSDAGRIRYYRINPRGDRRYRLSDLQRFLAGAAEGPAVDTASHLRDRAFHPGDDRPGRQGPGRRFRGRAPDLPGAPAGLRERGADRAATGDAMADESAVTVAVLGGLGRIGASIAGRAVDAAALLEQAASILRDGAGFRHVSVWRESGFRLEPVAVAGATALRLRPVTIESGLLGSALGSSGQVAGAGTAGGEISVSGLPGREIACAIPGTPDLRAALLAVRRDGEAPSPGTQRLLVAAAEAIGGILAASDAAGELQGRLHRAEALGRVATDIGSRLDPDQVLTRLVDHTLAMFKGDRAAVFLYEPDGSRRAVIARGLSEAYLASTKRAGRLLLATTAFEERRPIFLVGSKDSPQAAEIRAAIVQEGYDTICLAPLIDDESGAFIGSLNVYHDRPRPWVEDELETMAALAAHAAIAIRSARTYGQLASWAAQLQSIQQLGTRLNRLSDVEAIGTAIATELHELIDYHNVRVYRLAGDDLIPVAMRGQVGEYIDETPDQLRVKVGSGITGWVAANRIAQNLPNAAADPRANTIPGTEPDLDESMLLAPMMFDDEVVGVLVLSKLGLSQFSDDDLRLLVIYASFAAQALAHADATERLRRQVQSRRDLLAITESILTTLDSGSVFESVADRLGELVGWDNVAVELLDSGRDMLIPVMAKGVNAADYLEPWLPGEAGIATWVIEHNEAVVIQDQFDDPRVRAFESGRIHGGLVCVPLRGRRGAIGVLTIERIGEGKGFTDEEFELVELFAAQVSIAVQNAQAHGLITRQAETDDLTGLRNQRSFRLELTASVAAGTPFSVLMIDLDRFKLVNDRFGHEAGNDFLRRVAGAISDASRETDLAFRYGGDEFAVILSRTDADQAGPVADRIRSAIAAIGGPASGLGGAGFQVDASAGIATFPGDGATPDSILLAADRACFFAKRAGGGRVATAHDGLALAGEFTLQVPTPIDLGS